MGAAIFGLFGSLTGAIIGSGDRVIESFDVESSPAPDIDRVLARLNSYARISGEIPANLVFVATPTKAERSQPVKNEVLPEARPNTPAIKFERFHLELGSGFFAPRGAGQLEYLFKQVGLGEAITNDLLVFSYPSDYPLISNNRKTPDVFVEYSLSPKIALGVLYAPLGDYTVEGCRVRESPYFGIAAFPTLTGSFKADMVFLTASIYPLPETFARKTRLKLTGGLGYGKMKMEFRGSEFYPLGQYPLFLTDNTFQSFSKRIKGAFFTAEMVRYFGWHLSFGIEAGYRYAAQKIQGFSIICPYHFDIPNASGGFLVFDSLRLDIPGRTYNFGGIEAGAKIGIHF